MRRPDRKLLVLLSACGVAVALLVAGSGSMNAAPQAALFNDSHFHLTNYVQRGPDAGTSCGWSGRRWDASRCSGSRCSSSGRTACPGDFAPTYYLQSDAPLYYYSFTDAHIALAYRSLLARRSGRASIR